MTNKEPDYVYILTNPTFREDWVKTGKRSAVKDNSSNMKEGNKIV